MKRFMLASLAVFCFTAVTFAQEKPDQKKKAPIEKTTKHKTAATSHKKAAAKAPNTPAEKKSEHRK